MDCPGVTSFTFRPDREAYIRHAGTDQLTPQAIFFGISIPVAAGILFYALEFSNLTCVLVLSAGVALVVFGAIPYSCYLAGKAFDESPVLSAPMKLHFNETGYALVTDVRSDLEDPYYMTSWIVVSEDLVLMSRPELMEKMIPIRLTEIDEEVRKRFLQYLENDWLTAALTLPPGWHLCRNCGEFTRTGDSVDGQAACVRCKEAYQQRLREGGGAKHHRSKTGRFAVPVLIGLLDAGIAVTAFLLGQGFILARVAPWTRPLDRVTNASFIVCLAFSGFTVLLFLGTLAFWMAVRRDNRVHDHPLLTLLLVWTALVAIAGLLPALLF